MKSSSIVILKLAVFLIGAFVLGICIFWLPVLANEAAVLNPEYAYLEIPVLIGIYFTVVPFFYALYQAYKILQYIKKGHAFSEAAVFSLGEIKKCAFAIIMMYLSGMIFLFIQNALHPGIAILGIVIMFATAVISFFAAVLQELLRSALAIKIENDLTI